MDWEDEGVGDMDIDEDIVAGGGCDCSVDDLVSVVESGDAFSRNEVVLE